MNDYFDKTLLEKIMEKFVAGILFLAGVALALAFIAFMLLLVVAFYAFGSFLLNL